MVCKMEPIEREQVIAKYLSRSLDSEAQMEEERRLCYVGMTRAEKRLFISWARFRRRFGDRFFALSAVALCAAIGGVGLASLRACSSVRL